MGLNGTIRDYKEPYRTIADLIGPYLTLQTNTRHNKTYQDLTRPYRSISDHTGPYKKTLRELTGPYRALVDLTGPYWILQDQTCHNLCKSLQEIAVAKCFVTYLIITYLLKRSHQKKKKNYRLWTLSKHGWGVSGTAKLFFEKRYGHVIGRGGVKGPHPTQPQLNST